jgi:hypothetical protein
MFRRIPTATLFNADKKPGVVHIGEVPLAYIEEIASVAVLIVCAYFLYTRPLDSVATIVILMLMGLSRRISSEKALQKPEKADIPIDPENHPLWDNSLDEPQP